MRMGLTRIVTCLLCGVLCGAVGCGGNEQEEVIANSLSTLNDVTANLGEVKKAVRQAVTKNEEKKDQKITESDENLRRAFESAKNLRKLGDKLQKLKDWAERLKTKTTADYSKDLAGRYRPRFEEGVKAMEKESEDLNTTLTEAEGRANQGGKEMLTKIREELKGGRESFEVLTKQQR